jgi:hypothetical protein
MHVVLGFSLTEAPSPLTAWSASASNVSMPSTTAAPGHLMAPVMAPA